MDTKKVQKLTENLIYQRIKSCPRDLSKITQLNITGRHLVDVSLLRKLTGLEILSLSVNRIASLMDFRYCRKLKALFLRQNKVKDLSEVKYLMSLPNLTTFSLLENPCASDPSYRLTIIRNLRYLIELDDVPIVPDEKRNAQKFGMELFEDFEPFLEKRESGDDDCESLAGSEFFQDCEKQFNCETVEETPSKVMPYEFGDGDDKLDTTVKVSAQSVRSKTQSPSPRRREPKGVGCRASETKSCTSRQGDKAPTPTSNKYSAVLILVKELGRSELEALHAEVGAILASSCLSSQSSDRT